jgi:hypothetical protein
LHDVCRCHNALVDTWQSGLSAGAYAAKRGYSRTTLLKWADQQVASAFVRVEVVPATSSEVVVEVGEARVIVRPGFDAALVREVVRALSSRGG